MHLSHCKRRCGEPRPTVITLLEWAHPPGAPIRSCEQRKKSPPKDLDGTGINSCRFGDGVNDIAIERNAVLRTQRLGGAPLHRHLNAGYRHFVDTPPAELMGPRKIALAWGKVRGALMSSCTSLARTA